MTIAENDLAGAGSEIVAPEPVETPEVTTPASSAQEQQQEPAKPDGDDADKSLKRLQRRIDRVTAARYQEAARAEQAERQLAEYRAALERYQQPQAQEEQRIDPRDIDRIATQRAEEIATMRSVTERSNSVVEAGRKAHGDEFMASVATVIDAAGPLIDQRGMPTHLGEAVLDSENPAALLHYLGQNDDLAAELKGLSPARLARKLVAIEAELAKPKVSRAPAPLSPVTGKGAPVAKSESDMTDAEWYEQRRKSRY